MDEMLEKIWSYGMLKPEDQAAIDRQVQSHPANKALLEDVKKLYALLQSAGLMEGADDIGLAYFIAEECLEQSSEMSPLRSAYQRMKSRVEEDPEIHTRYLALKSRMEEVAAQSNPAAHFEQLTGHKLAEIPIHGESPESTEGSDSRQDRPPVVRERLLYGNQWVRSGMYVLAAVVVGLMILFQVNRHDRLGYLNAATMELDMPVGVRGINEAGHDNLALQPANEQQFSEDPGTMRLAQWILFRDAVEQLTQAQEVWLGVFYTSDDALLREAGRKFEQLLEQEELDARLERLSKFMLAKIYIVEEAEANALVLLEDVAHETDDLAGPAARLIHKLVKK